MSTSSEFSYQKPSFSQKCSMLSQYLKEKGSFGDLSLGMTCSTQPAPAVTQELSRPAPIVATTMNLFPQQSGFVSPRSKEDAPKLADARVNKAAKSEPQIAQMTIFYGGKVMVFNDLPAEQAKEVMLCARKGSSQSQTKLLPQTSQIVPNQADVQRPPQAAASDLPIARRASLHRFLEKRKDRVSAKPYQINSPDLSSPSPPKAAESKPWLGLAGQRFQC